ncbi:MAG: SUF system Fe-S cluster assembly regulator [Gammaproteobacteria bacterium]|nr:SUF system Fe-S cluster assembly regulator [Gammaproteobacteria bacterium]MBQ08984.1 SUF system Fe-S cluster assembly regulator [Gammaproteobacteria bacterium]MDP6146917.1 SUF system Fe-S cluster assembly regulator [Gammaproteobacteria bacterium]HJL80179.1 SUF system Fe-S cluster assembly regulator [Gammaproteobacteria bacterium]HJM09586.1 SUF system Fe-S cluster assembly regulator [Gammaproteobacteria bacterium]
MLRITKMTDYAVLILANLALHDKKFLTAKEIASETHISLPTSQKILKKLNRNNLVISKQGASGGYALEDDTKNISVAALLKTLNGDLSITQCSSNDHQCQVEDFCNIGDAWQMINQRVQWALNDITLGDLIHPTRIEQFISTNIPVTRNH